MIALQYSPEDAQIAVNGVPLVDLLLDDCACGEPSEYGGHGIRDGAVYDEYYCEKCYFKKKREYGKFNK